MDKPFDVAMRMVTRNFWVIVFSAAIWTLGYAALIASYVGYLYYLDVVANLPQQQLNKRGPFVAIGLLCGILLLVSVHLAIFHTRAVEMLRGKILSFADCFNPKGAAGPFVAYLASKAIVLGPLLAFGIVTGLNEEKISNQPPLWWIAGALAILGWTLILGYLTMFATAAAAHYGLQAAFGKAASVALTRPGGTWQTIGVLFLTRLVENMLFIFAFPVTAPFLSFAMVTKFGQLSAHNLPSSRPGNTPY